MQSMHGISYNFFIIWLWTGVAIATVFFIGRLCARILGPRRLYTDDIFISITWVFVVATGVLWQLEAANMYYVIAVQEGLAVPVPNLWDRLHHWLVVFQVAQLLYYMATMTFKLSMLFFFRRLGSSVSWFRFVWWIILIFCVCSFCVAIGTTEFRCGLGDQHTVLTTCNSEEARIREMAVLDANCALDVISDFMIMTIAVILLWNVRVQNKGKKLAIMALFSLSLFTIAVSIVRVVLSKTSLPMSKADQIKAADLVFWNACQSFLCVVIACSSAFPQLFIASKRGTKKNKPTWSPTKSAHDRMLSSFRMRNRRQDTILLDTMATTQTGDDLESFGMQNGATNPLTPLESGTTIESRDRDGNRDVSRMEVMLVPSGPTPMTACYVIPRSEPVPRWHISRVQEYRVTQSST